MLKFSPCLQFQKLRTNVVHSGDAVVLSSTKAVCNRLPNLCTNYQGLRFRTQSDEEEDSDFLMELSDARVVASIEDATRWRISSYYGVTEVDRNKKSEDFLYVGDVIALNLSEKFLYLNALKPYNSFKKMLHQLHHFNKQNIRVQELESEELREPHPTPFNESDLEDEMMKKRAQPGKQT